MTAVPNLARLLADRAAATPAAAAFVAPDLRLSLGDFARVVARFAQKMADLGIGPGATVALDTQDRMIAAAAMFACAARGACFTSVTAQLLGPLPFRLTHVLKTPETEGLAGLDATLIDAGWSPRAATQPLPDLCALPEADAAPGWIMQSSGSTGMPKFMAVSADLLTRRVLAVAEEFTPGQTRATLLFEALTRPFLIRACAALVQGCCLVDSLDPGFLAREGVDLVCGSPRQMRRWLGARRLDPRIARLQLAGGRVDDDLAHAMLESFDRIEDVYGASETIKCHVNTITRQPGGLRITGRTVCAEVEILDPSGAPCPPGVAGELRVRSPYAVSGYLGDAEASRRAFRDGWFHPGDLAVWGAEGALQILDRRDDVVNLGGAKLSLTEIDRMMAATPGVAAAACAVVPGPDGIDRIAALVVPADPSAFEPTLDLVRDACTQAFGATGTPAPLVAVDRIPETPDGKLRRAECARLLTEILASPAALPPQTPATGAGPERKT